MAAPRRSVARKDEVEARIRAALDGLRPLLHIQPCVLELVEFHETSGVLVLRVEGECPDCDMTAAVLMEGIEAHLRLHVPEIRTVRPAGDLTLGTNG